MTRPAWSKWGALLCGSTVISFSLWQKPVRGLHQSANAKRHPTSLRGPTRNGKTCGLNSSFSVKLFGLFDHFITPWELEWMKSISCVRFFAIPWTISYQVPPSMGFSRQEYWSGLTLIRSTNLIYWMIDFQRTCDLCCYCVLWLRSQTWIGSQEVPSLTRNGKFGS